MKNLITIFLIFILFFMLSCSKVDNVKSVEADFVELIPFELKIENGSVSEITGRIGNEIYFLNKNGDAFSLNFLNMETDKIKSITIDSGKGPGELFMPMSMAYQDGKFYIYDMYLKRISIFNRDGSFEDLINFKEEIGWPHSFDVFKDKFVFDGSLHNKIVLLNREGKIEKKIPYKEIQMMPKEGNDFRGGVIKCDENFIYLGYYKSPFRIEKYNENLEKVDTISKNVNVKKINNLKWNMSMGFPAPVGTFIVSNIFVHDNLIYTNSVSGYDIIIKGKEKKYEPLYYDFYLNVFDKKDNKLKYQITSDRIEKCSGYEIININEDYIILFVRENMIKYFDENAEYTKGILILENPKNKIK